MGPSVADAILVTRSRSAIGTPTAQTVLLVEDDPAVARLLQLALERAGFGVSTAQTGAEALGLLAAAAPTQGIQAVALDLRLPDGRGSTVLEWLRGARSAAASGPVWVAMSSLDEQDAIAEFGPLHGRFLAKPFDPWALVSRIQELLRE